MKTFKSARSAITEGKGFLEYDEWLKKEKGIKKGRKSLNSAKHKTYATEWRAYVKDLFGKLPPLPSMVESKLDDEENELLDTDSVEEANIVKVVDGLVDKIASSGNFKGAIAWQEYEDTRKKNAKYDAKDKKKALEIIKKFKIK